MALSKKHYIAIAKIVRESEQAGLFHNPAGRNTCSKEFAERLAEYFYEQSAYSLNGNKLFSKEKFVKACTEGV